MGRPSRHIDIWVRLAESACEAGHERRLEGYGVEQQKPLPVVCKEVKLDRGYRLDLVVEDGR